MDRIDEITDEMWNDVNEFNKTIRDDFLDNQIHLSKKTLLNYQSATRIFLWWVKEFLNNKKIVDMKKIEFQRYVNWLSKRGLSEAAIKLKVSAVSSLCNHIEVYYEDDYPTFRNLTKDAKIPITGKIHEKIPLTQDEYDELCDRLEKLEKWQVLAWLKFTYSSACRRAEARQLLKEVTGYKPIIKTVTIRDDDGNKSQVESVSYKTHMIRCKGRSQEGKQRKLQFSQDAMDSINKWLEVRGEDDCPYVFVTTMLDGTVQQVSETTFNHWCSGLLTKLMGRRMNPHIIRSSRATNIVVAEGKSPEVAQKLLGHESSETTIKHYIVREDEEDADEAFI